MTLENKSLIQDAAAKTAAKTANKSPSQRMRDVLNMQGTQSYLSEIIQENKGAFVASLIDLYGSDDYLSKCDPNEVLKEAVKAISLKLPISKQLGFAYIIPYKDKNQGGRQVPRFQLGYKGTIQLALRTGVYRHINAGPVYEGMLKAQNYLTGMVDLSGEPESEKVIGYFAYIETLNGFAKALFWTTKKVIEHAKRYSQSYNSGNPIWKQNFNEMATKSVLKYLLDHWGLMSVDTQAAAAIINDDAINAADEIITEGVDFETGEVLPVDGEVK